jgi:hypothetical protein
MTNKEWSAVGVMVCGILTKIYVESRERGACASALEGGSAGEPDHR